MYKANDADHKKKRQAMPVFFRTTLAAYLPVDAFTSAWPSALTAAVLALSALASAFTTAGVAGTVVAAGACANAALTNNVAAKEARNLFM